MNLLKILFLFSILIFQDFTAGHSRENCSDYSNVEDECERYGYNCPFKRDEVDIDYDDYSSLKECDGNCDKCLFKSKNERSQTDCNICGIANIGSETGKIINGIPVYPEYKYPWIVQLIKENQILCGGTLISATFVMTASHCVFNEKMSHLPECSGKRVARDCYVKPNEITVGLLIPQHETPSETLAVSRILSHPKFNSITNMYDFALLQLAKPVDCSVNTMPVCLPPRNLRTSGTTLIAVGYGLNIPEGNDKPQVLREGFLREIDPQYCLIHLKSSCGFANSIICANGKESGQSSCKGDSGSPLLVDIERKFYAVGIASTEYKGCSPSDPQTYSKVYAFMPFIKQHVKDLPRG